MATKQPHANVSELLQASIKKDHFIAGGGSAFVYELDDPELKKNYVLRVLQPKTSSDTDIGAYSPKMVDHFKDRLLKTTSLTPAKAMISKHHVGQVLMVSEGAMAANASPAFSIMLRQPGKSIKDWIVIEKSKLSSSLNDEVAEARAETAVIKALNQLDQSAFERLFEDRYRLTLAGFPSDISISNIMFDPTDKAFGLSLVDIYSNKVAYVPAGHKPAEPKTKKAALTKVNVLSMEITHIDDHSNYEYDPALKRQYNTEIANLKTKVDAAKEAVFKRIEEEKVEPISFTTVESALAVKLTDPPQTLIENLRRIRQQAQLEKS